MDHTAFRTDHVAVRMRKHAMTIVSVDAVVTDRSNNRAGVERGTA